MSTTDNAIRRAASRLRALVFVAMVIIVLLYAAARLNLQLADAHIEYRLPEVGAPYDRAIAAGAILLLLVSLFRLSQMLGLIAGGELFSKTVIGRFRGFALWLLLMAVFELVAPLIVAAMEATRMPHELRLAFHLRDLLTVGITLLLFLLANLLERARSLDEEMREFV